MGRPLKRFKHLYEVTIVSKDDGTRYMHPVVAYSKHMAATHIEVQMIAREHFAGHTVDIYAEPSVVLH